MHFFSFVQVTIDVRCNIFSQIRHNMLSLDSEKEELSLNTKALESLRRNGKIEEEI